jgi:4-hydroxybutyrate CoA-transferase
MILADAASVAEALLDAKSLATSRTSVTVLSAMWPDQPDELLGALINEARNRQLPLHLLIADLSGRLAFLDDDGLKQLAGGSLRITTLAGSVPRRLAPLIGYRTETLSELGGLLESGALLFDIFLTRASNRIPVDSPTSFGAPMHFHNMVGYGPAAIAQASSLGLELVPGAEHVETPAIVTVSPTFAYETSAASDSPSPAASPTPEQQRIGERVAALIPEHATLQLGLGAIPDALIAALDPEGSYGVHCGMLPPSALKAITDGVLTGRHKGRDVGLHVASGMSPLTQSQLQHWMQSSNSSVHLRPLNATHDPAVLASLHRLWAINSAFEVDLAGDINAEWIGDVRSTSGGGQADFARAAHLQPDGASVIALPSRARDGSPRIVRALDHEPTTPGRDVDIIVTEFGVADLRECTAAQRASRIAQIAHPDDRHLLA